MKKKFLYLINFYVIFLFFFLSCSIKNNVSYDKTTVYDEWINFHNNYFSGKSKNDLIYQLSNIKYEIENSFSTDSNSYPESRNVNSDLIKNITQRLSELIENLQNESDSNLIIDIIDELNKNIFLLEHNDFISVKQINYQYVQFFELLCVCCVFIVGFLIYFNNKELKNKQNQIDASKKYLKYVIKTQEDERSRISRELHDTIAQDMRYVGLLLSKLPENEILKEVQKYQSDCINQIRNLCYNFAPPDIKKGNLQNALQTLITDFLQKSDIDLRLTILENVNFKVFEKEELLHIYRIVQESISNIEKHAKASEATILFRCDKIQNKNIYKLVITDDGIGIDVDLIEKMNNESTFIKKADGNHFGISGMKERVALLNGNIHFNSMPDFGTEIVITIEK